jgi:hypothetical protein
MVICVHTVFCQSVCLDKVMDSSLLETAITQRSSIGQYLRNVGNTDYIYTMPSPGNKHWNPVKAWILMLFSFFMSVACRSLTILLFENVTGAWNIFTTHTHTHTHNVVDEWLKLQLRIREIPSSNLGPKTGYPSWGFSWFSSAPPGQYLEFGHVRFLPYPTQFVVHLSSFHSTLHTPRQWKSVVKQTTNKYRMLQNIYLEETRETQLSCVIRGLYNVFHLLG